MLSQTLRPPSSGATQRPLPLTERPLSSGAVRKERSSSFAADPGRSTSKLSQLSQRSRSNSGVELKFVLSSYRDVASRKGVQNSQCLVDASQNTLLFAELNPLKAPSHGNFVQALPCSKSSSRVASKTAEPSCAPLEGLLDVVKPSKKEHGAKLSATQSNGKTGRSGKREILDYLNRRRELPAWISKVPPPSKRPRPVAPRRPKVGAVPGKGDDAGAKVLRRMSKSLLDVLVGAPGATLEKKEEEEDSDDDSSVFDPNASVSSTASKAITKRQGKDKEGLDAARTSFAKRGASKEPSRPSAGPEFMRSVSKGSKGSSRTSSKRSARTTEPVPSAPRRGSVAPRASIALKRGSAMSRASISRGTAKSSRGSVLSSKVGGKANDGASRSLFADGGIAARKTALLFRKDAQYGLQDLNEVIARIHQAYFSGGDLFPDKESMMPLQRAFNRFRKGGGQEVPIDDLCEMLRICGYAVEDPESVMNLAREVTKYSEMDFQEFVEFTEKYDKHLFEQNKLLFASYDEDGSGEIDASELRKLLSDMGYVVYRPMIEEALMVVDDGNGDLDFEEFIKFLAVYKHAEGFTQEILEDLFRIYTGFAQDAAKKGKEGLQVVDLEHALVAYFGLNSRPGAIRMCRKLEGGPKSGDSISFREFLSFAARLRLQEKMDYKAAFDMFDANGNGEMDVSEISQLMEHLGYRPMRKVIDEVLDEVDFEGDGELDFEEFFHFIMVFRRRDGFTLAQLAKYEEVFQRCDEDRSESICQQELGEMLRYLGYNIGKDDLYLLVAEVDLNRNGALDKHEFNRLMRLNRESELQMMRRIFDEQADEMGMLSPKQIFSCVQEWIGKDKPTKYVRNAAALKVQRLQREQRDIDFEEFVDLCDTAFWAKVEGERKFAGFSTQEITALHTVFEKYDEDGSGDIDAGEMQKMLVDFGLSFRTKVERQVALSCVDEAKALARKAGVKRTEAQKDSFMTFWELVQTVRLVKSKQSKKKEQEVKAKMINLTLTQQEIDEYRVIFLHWATIDSQNPREYSALGRRIALAELDVSRRDTKVENIQCILAEEETSLPVLTFHRLLRALGLKTSQGQKQTIDTEITKCDLNTKGDLVFTGFLQIMEWMVKTNFADINDVIQA
eukprot:TRINITY_DN92660_c0_g1_i1.p1 TRINITY_DN92660_c0_g1~~TRINITY_DN92660_c0_g1_i1.p1  ORF type:complete len:1143 (-),score=239.62 TRINITY_DN92660_c0_g1_i1:48-3425(-)